MAAGEVLRISGIVKESIVDGPGFRMTVFAQGCERACPGCHNPETHAFDGGYEVPCAEIIGEAKKNPLLRGLTFSGGEPFLQAPAFVALARMARAAGLDVVTYTGYTIEQILERREGAADGFRALLRETDILVDGPYIAAQRTLGAGFRGSRNQRVIDVAATLAAPGPSGPPDGADICVKLYRFNK
jgi:anaerobic ribonucleoside-triphosphate reductase activating protein